MSYDRQRAETVEDPDHVRMSRDAGMCGTRGSTRSVKAVHNSVIYARFFLHLSCMPMGGSGVQSPVRGERGLFSAKLVHEKNYRLRDKSVFTPTSLLPQQ